MLLVYTLWSCTGHAEREHLTHRGLCVILDMSPIFTYFLQPLEITVQNRQKGWVKCVLPRLHFPEDRMKVLLCARCYNLFLTFIYCLITNLNRVACSDLNFQCVHNHNYIYSCHCLNQTQTCKPGEWDVEILHYLLFKWKDVMPVLWLSMAGQNSGGLYLL